MMQVVLTQETEKIVRQQIERGYSSPEEVVSEALRLLEALYQRKLAALQAALIEGEESGDAIESNLDELEREAMAELDAGVIEIDPRVCPPTTT